MEKLMQKYVPYTFFLLIFACIAACGGGSTTAPIPIYDLPAVLAPANTLMGGAVQGTALNLGNTVSTLAGTPGSAGFGNYSANSSSAAKFNQPNDITTDGINFYVADYKNNVIRQITPSGDRVTTLSNPVTGLPLAFNRPTGITTDGIRLYVVANGSNSISFIEITTKEVTTIGSATGLAGSVDSTVPADVRFNQPAGITTDGDNLYVTDSGNHTVRRIVIATKAVSTLAGTSGTIGSTGGIQGAARFNLPWRITTDRASLYLTDFMNHTIRQIDILTGMVTTIAGAPGPLSKDGGTTDGIGAEARFNQPNGITTDGAYLYVTDSYKNIIRRIDKSAPYNVTTIPIPVSSLHTPIGITTDGVSLFVADTFTVYRDPKTYRDTETRSDSILRIK